MPFINSIVLFHNTTYVTLLAKHVICNKAKYMDKGYVRCLGEVYSKYKKMSHPTSWNRQTTISDFQNHQDLMDFHVGEWTVLYPYENFVYQNLIDSPKRLKKEASELYLLYPLVCDYFEDRIIGIWNYSIHPVKYDDPMGVIDLATKLSNKENVYDKVREFTEMLKSNDRPTLVREISKVQRN